MIPPSRSVPTLRPDAQSEWLRGCLFRAYVLQKDRADVRPAAQLLRQVRAQLPPVTPEDTSFLSAQAQRLHGRALIRLGSPDGRKLIFDLFEGIGGLDAFRDVDEGQRSRLLQDISLDLTVIGYHRQAVAAADLLAHADGVPATRARRLGNLASAHLQRAVAHRARGDACSALADLDQAQIAAREALDLWQVNTAGPVQGLAIREVRAIALSACVERSWLTEVDLCPVVKDLHGLLRACLGLPRDETYIQVLYRIGRLGAAHLRLGVANPRSAENHVSRARAYLEMAWRTSGNACVRPWLAAELLAALQEDGDAPAARAFA